jgi:HK97 family phage prohead protease
MAEKTQVVRTLQECPFELKEVSESGVFSGYGSVFDVIDDGGDIIQAGAFAASLADWAMKGRAPAMLWQHSMREPIGAWEIVRETDKGLFVQGQLALKTQRGAEAYELMKMKALSGLSVGYMTREDSRDQKTGIRTIKQADLWEISPVTFPMNDAARISAVKSIEEIIDFKSAERFLREAGNLSRSEATAFIARVKGLMQRDSAADDEATQRAVAALRRRQELLSAR